MANRGAAFDEHVSTIEDLKELGSKKLPKMYRGNYYTCWRWNARSLIILAIDYFNQGAMDLIT